MRNRSSYWQRVADQSAAAAQTPMGRVMMPLGFRIAHTGGNCWAWEYRLPSGQFVWITDGDADLGVNEDDGFICSFYQSDDDEAPTAFECAHIKDALDMAWGFMTNAFSSELATGRANELLAANKRAR